MEIDITRKDLCLQVSQLTSVSEEEVKKVIDGFIELFSKRLKLK